ncbi:type III secretion system needle length determinant [Vibrio azureus]|uniref:Putative type III secretion system protein n=1 Tax=Vibrio azureus NBRC 104587 TaxID=1219077 RepID=U3CHZ6_9VIBR|nr:type III secretion system needle length determinant [Vibrio azureus]AUI86214.1 type III secretion system needle length determinant [Vibrio azureus]GAD77863.1 putative type III secretion system protein [Vibrio azureus NBRC 104587]
MRLKSEPQNSIENCIAEHHLPQKKQRQNKLTANHSAVETLELKMNKAMSKNDAKKNSDALATSPALPESSDNVNTPFNEILESTTQTANSALSATTSDALMLQKFSHIKQTKSAIDTDTTRSGVSSSDTTPHTSPLYTDNSKEAEAPLNRSSTAQANLMLPAQKPLKDRAPSKKLKEVENSDKQEINTINTATASSLQHSHFESIAKPETTEPNIKPEQDSKHSKVLLNLNTNQAMTSAKETKELNSRIIDKSLNKKEEPESLSHLASPMVRMTQGDIILKNLEVIAPTKDDHSLTQLVNKLVEKIWVSLPSANEKEVRVFLNEGLLKGGEISIKQSAEGYSVTIRQEQALTLINQQSRQDLVERLQKLVTDAPIRVSVSEQMNQQSDQQRSRQQRNIYDEWNPEED